MKDEVEVCLVNEGYMMHDYVKTLYHEWVEDLLMFFCIYPSVALLNRAFNMNSSMTLLGFLLIIPIYVMTYLRVKISRKNTLYIGLSIVMLISTIVIVGIGGQYLLEFVLIIWAIQCIRKSRHKQNYIFDVTNLITYEEALVPQLILPAAFGFKDIQLMVLVNAIVIMIVSTIYICKARNMKLILDNKKNGSYKSKSSNIFLVEIIVLIGINLCILYALGVLQEACYLTQKFSAWGINYCFELTKMQAPGSVVEAANAASGGVRSPFGMANSSNGGFLMKLLSILIFAGIIIVIMIVVGSLLAASYFIINYIFLTIKIFRNKEKVTYVSNKPNEDEEKQKVSMNKWHINRIIFVNDKDKVRKIYKDRILKYRKKNIFVNSRYSANDIKNEIFNVTTDNLSDITKIYEKARYSDQIITKEELRLIKKSDK
ncbi:hypothetical protein [Inconstantimicrobium mannanitabidum]|uniref:Uncharacterized protein n=1 Tax=Inconstantimicrobium mannanitabidum TaxID=1604901 RepID=A0ACB5REG1_9CLOT|nr:hypothetical protein [Clostridium sp. TW13]GKX67159.1 hypothetical protein rsdtw13_24170 [Clostridium sp. TW13]